VRTRVPRSPASWASSKKIRTFLAWLEDRPVCPPRTVPPPISELTGADVADFQKHLLARFTNPQYRQGYRSAVRYLWRLRHVLGEHALPFDPSHLPGWGEGTRRAPAAENSTDRIPERVHAPLLIWAMRFIDDFGPDILAAIDAWQALRGPTRATSCVGMGRKSGLAADLRRYLDDHLTHRRPLPGHQGKPNIRAISLAVRCSTRPLETRYRDQIDAVAAEVGIAPHAWVDIAITGRLDGRPWLDDIAVEPRPTTACPSGLGCCRPPATWSLCSCPGCVTASSQAPAPRLPDHRTRPAGRALPVEGHQPGVQGRA
jgi:hypothetical protein